HLELGWRLPLQGGRMRATTALRLWALLAILLYASAAHDGTSDELQCSSAPQAWPAATGAPTAQPGDDVPDIRILCNPGFVIGYDRRRGSAAWVAYRVTPVLAYRHLPRPEFQPDPRVEPAAPHAIYRQRKYDRGHLAPNYAMAQLHGHKAQIHSFYFSNIAPQSQRLNQLLWQRLEEIEIDRLAPRLGRLWVLVGPIHGAAESPVPSAFFRIWLGRMGDAGPWQAMAFRVPQAGHGDERRDDCLQIRRTA